MEIPVYLFTGFLGAGKTLFIQETLEAPDFFNGERTLVMVCEEGEEEYEPSKFAGENVFVEVIEDEEDLTADLMCELEVKYRPDRVLVEYNGMWSLDSLYNNLPENWMPAQEMSFADATTFIMYDQNMRQQNFDKMRSAELIVFNRCQHDDAFEEFKQTAHKIVRVANRKTQIVYEFGPDDILPDDIIDPLPYDMNADLIDIEDDMFAEWYRDINENQDDYEGKEFRIRGRAAVGPGLAPDEFIFGRHVMTCCVDDIQFAGLICKWKPDHDIPNGAWMKVRFTVKNEYNSVYEGVGPVLYCSRVNPAEACDPEVATF